MALWDTLAAKVTLRAAEMGYTPTQAAQMMRDQGATLPAIVDRVAAQTVEQAAQIVTDREREKSSGFLGAINTYVAPIVKAVGPVALGALAAGAAAPLIGTAAKAAGSLVTGMTGGGSKLAPTQPTGLPAALPVAYAPQPQQGTKPMEFDLSGLLNTGLQAAMQYKLAEQQQRLIPDHGPIMPGGFGGAQVTQAAFPLAGMLGAGALIAGGGALVRAVGGRVMTALGAMTRKRVVAIAKQLGIAGASTALGIGAVEIAQMVIDDGKKKGRGKGVSAANIRTTKRTLRTVVGLYKQVQGACSSAGVRGRARTVFVGKGKSCR